uniref:Uncharacterized protein n=1 Tax=Knipowitschia caucasica TaxID=637954 RepID=A0AAV2KSX1_KNICA
MRGVTRAQLLWSDLSVRKGDTPPMRAEGMEMDASLSAPWPRTSPGPAQDQPLAQNQPKTSPEPAPGPKTAKNQPLVQNQTPA